MLGVIEHEFRSFTDEMDRKAKRKELKRRLAEHEVKAARRREIEAAIRDIEDEVDAETSRHQDAARPIQNDLADIEAEQIERIADGRGADDKLDARRRKLLDRLEDLNAALENFSSEGGCRIKFLRQGLLKTKSEYVPDLIYTQLVELGEPGTLNRYKVRVGMVKVLGSWHREVQGKIARYRSLTSPEARNLYEKQANDIHEARLARLLIEEELVNELVADANREAARLRQELTDE